MKRQFQTFFLSLLTPGLGYFHIGDRRSFYRALALFVGVILTGVLLRLVTSYRGWLFILVSLATIYVFTALHPLLKAKAAGVQPKHGGILKFLFTLGFVFLTVLSFANKRTVMGFDMMSMEVSAMQPTLMQGEKFLVDTWTYKKGGPKRGDVIVHSFPGQRGLYVNRIIATGRDTIELKRGTVFLNGHVVAEPYALPAAVTPQPSREIKAIIIPEGCYFVMGDNREGSLGDSRFSGWITSGHIIGKVTDIVSSSYESRTGNTIK